MNNNKNLYGDPKNGNKAEENNNKYFSKTNNKNDTTNISNPTNLEATFSQSKISLNNTKNNESYLYDLSGPLAGGVGE
jgi:hypothetical protein